MKNESTEMSQQFWEKLDELLLSSKIIIDRPRGTHHPKYSNIIYPLDYGYLENTKSMDGGGIDVWVGSLKKDIRGIICTVDLLKRDSEIKILIGCTDDEIRKIYEFHNQDDYMKGILVRK
ncbi:MAG: inorganic pyrophosphatase [Bacilli bacterium]|nr:inorganic pyrophosphatase [Bacilli bacterium]